MNRFYLTSILCCSIALSVSSQDAGELVVSALDAYLNNDIEKADELMTGIGHITDPFWDARAAIVFGLLAEYREDLEESERQYKRAETIAMTAVGLADTATGFAVVSEAKSRLMLIKGIAYIIRNASVAEDYAERALEIEPENITALLVFSQGKTNAPRLFGGNIALGIEILEKVLKQDITNAQRFTVYYALSVAWEKKRKWVLSKEMVDKCLEIYPENLEARAQKKSLADR